VAPSPQRQQQPAIFTPPIKPQPHNMLREEYENPRGWAEIQTPTAPNEIFAQKIHVQ
jgi:hypothetical protein